jgi:hypothetical protein
MRIGARTALAALALGGLVMHAAAQEYCVTCNGPDAVYRCVLSAPPGLTPPTSRAQLLCITELARGGGHASCSVRRTPGEQCVGEARTVLFPSAGPDQLPIEAGQPLPPPVETGTNAEGPLSPEPTAPDAEPSPSTAAKIAKDAVDASNAGLKKAGEAVSNTAESAGNAVKKTWDCFSSLFSDC